MRTFSLAKLILRFLPAPFYRIARRVYLRSRFVVCSMITRVKIMLSLPLKPKLKKIRFEIHLAEHCNLNCYACNNFSPIAEHEFVDVEEFRRDFARMAEIFSHSCERIYLLGGEPLLHPEINTLIKIARENFPEGDIFIFTNGILLPRMDDEFWQTCHNYNTGIILSAYPIKIDMEKVKSMADTFGVNFQYAWGESNSMRDSFTIMPMNLNGDSDAKLNFGVCKRAVNCITLHHGKLFTCSLLPTIKHFNRKFGQDLAITSEDYVNIYDDVSAEEVLRRMCQPVPACRY